MLTGQSSISFSLSPTARSTRPPILHAFEVYKVLDLSNPMTAAGDFDAINHVRRMYGLQTKEDWLGDPCSPSTFMWSELNCSNDGDPGIISLDLSNYQLTGPVPDFFARMKSLKALYLSGNNLDGSIPQDLMKKKADGTQLLRKTDRNKTESYCSDRLLNVGNRCGGLVVSSGSTPKIFTHSELQSMTSNFHTIIGRGSFGKVYFGRLEDGTRVAVNVLSPTSKQGCKEFQAEAKLLKVVHHRNLVTLIGYRDDPEHMAFVYEYMSNGNLREHLSDRLYILSWPERLQIATGAAQGSTFLSLCNTKQNHGFKLTFHLAYEGLEYLHSGCTPSIIHRDFKTANILLDENIRAKISDLGLSRAFATLHDTHISTTPGGTPG
ncbi:hypothetical protein MLD38_037442 [Melastoma candidum]|uniref:Uncharacterized protein n=1 Tax=Melastoma candidum TaxID=119954 RepID=A0ACB9LMC3_9MYRT|nr:hypothetical protein MLD38_037442 [Melastoma candidum]